MKKSLTATEKKNLFCCLCFQLPSAKLPLFPAEFMSEETLQKSHRIHPQSAGPAGCSRCSPKWPGKSCGTVPFIWPCSRGKNKVQMDGRGGKGVVWFDGFPKLPNKIIRGGYGNTSFPACRDRPTSANVSSVTGCRAGLQSGVGGGGVGVGLLWPRPRDDVTDDVTASPLPSPSPSPGSPPPPLAPFHGGGGGDGWPEVGAGGGWGWGEGPLWPRPP